jgi:segregation and condensation protein A
LGSLVEELYKVKIENIFEGPMDLLVHLIKKNEVPINNIPIALITRQYMEYLEWIKLMDLDNAGDFILMASTLLQIKSRTLLPVHGENEEDEDPRLAIARPLMEYLRYKSAAELLAERNLLGEGAFVRKPCEEDLPEPGTDEIVKIGLFELIDAFQAILSRVSGQHQVDLTSDSISVKDRISQIVDLLEEKGSVSFDELFSDLAPTRSDVIITFLALLEMVKLTLVRLTQHVQTGAIRLFYL